MVVLFAVQPANLDKKKRTKKWCKSYRAFFSRSSQMPTICFHQTFFYCSEGICQRLEQKPFRKRHNLNCACVAKPAARHCKVNSVSFVKKASLSPIQTYSAISNDNIHYDRITQDWSELLRPCWLFARDVRRHVV